MSMTLRIASRECRAMTGAQASYLDTLCEEVGDTFDPSLTRAFSSKVDTTLRRENATKQRLRVPFRFNRNGKGSKADASKMIDELPKQDPRLTNPGGR
jgi:hypothetical protein